MTIISLWQLLSQVHDYVQTTKLQHLLRAHCHVLAVVCRSLFADRTQQLACCVWLRLLFAFVMCIALNVVGVVVVGGGTFVWCFHWSYAGH